MTTDPPSQRTSGSPVRKRLAAAVVALCIVIVLSMWLTGHVGRPERRWNVVLVTLDTTRADHLSPYGYEHLGTPTLESLSREGVTYDRAYTPVPLTLPSHCSMMTGLLPSAHGILVNGASAIDQEAVTLAEVLGSSGYSTRAVVAAFVLDHRFGLDQGFEVYEDDLSAGTNPGPFYYAERNAELVTNAALRLMEQRPGRPLFIWVHYFDPHAPYEPPGFDPADSELIAYDAEIAFVDSQLGRLIGYIDASDLRDNTLVIALADHGEALWEHGEPTHGLFTYEGTLRVPLIVRFPDRRYAGTRIAQPVSVVDVMPSVLTWTGRTVPGNLDGEELPVDQDGRPRPIYFENWHPMEFYGWSPTAGVVLGDHKLIDAPRRELFDVREDPYETRNLYEPGDERATALLAALGGVRQTLEERGVLGTPGITMDEETAAKLGALGYVAPGRSGPGEVLSIDPLGKDPKDMISVYHLVLSATSEIENDRILEAADLLVGVLTEDPANRRAILLLAGMVGHDDARRTVMEALEEIKVGSIPTEEMVEVYYARGEGLTLEGRPAEAAEAFRAALQVDPDHERARWGLVGALSDLRSPSEEIVPHLERLVSADPGDLRYVVPLARAYDRQRLEDEVLTLYEAAVEARPQEPIAKNNLAWFHGKYGRSLSAALSLADAAISAEPEIATYHHTRGYVLWKLRRLTDSVAALETAASLDPTLAECHYHLGVVYLELGDVSSAKVALDRAVELAAADPPVWFADALGRRAELADRR
jgi:arylsulfatase A-like enzyme/tetratricopeptide (TPR) repeat protein